MFEPGLFPGEQHPLQEALRQLFTDSRSESLKQDGLAVSTLRAMDPRQDLKGQVSHGLTIPIAKVVSHFLQGAEGEIRPSLSAAQFDKCDPETLFAFRATAFDG